MDIGLQSIYLNCYPTAVTNIYKFSFVYVILKIMFKRFSIHLVLIFLFAFAQIGVVTHEISHVEDLATHNQQNQSQQDSNNQDPSNQDQSPHSEQCEQCISFAKIAGGLVAQGFVLPVLQANAIGVTQLQTQGSPQLYVAYAARAPPTTPLI